MGCPEKQANERRFRAARVFSRFYSRCRQPVLLRTETVDRGVGVGLAGAQDRRREVRLIGRVGIMLRFEAKAHAILIGHAVFAHFRAIEEIARIYGYDAIPETTGFAETPLATVTESQIELEQVALTLVARDYQEIIGYSFVDAKDRLTMRVPPFLDKTRGRRIIKLGNVHIFIPLCL